MNSFDVTCLDEFQAWAFNGWLDRQGVDSTYDKEVVNIPYGGNVGFMMEVYQSAVDFGFAADDTASDEMCALLP